MAQKYTKEQITAYYDRISIPEALRIYDVTDMSPKAALSYLKELQKHHLVSVPFENLALHYSPHRSIVLHPDELYRKIILKNRGGYCMELNAVFGTLLRSVNYKLYTIGARVNNGKGFGPWDHMLNILTLGDSRYVVDVGFGSNYVPIAPVKLINDTTGFTNVEPASARLVFKALDTSADPYKKLWVYQHRIASDSEFKDMFCFADVEFHGADFEMMNLWTSSSPKSIFTQRVICNKLILGEGKKEGEIVGTVTLMRDLKKRVGAKTEVLKEFKSESERVQALKEHFEIELSEAEKDAIRGTVNEMN